MEQQCYVCHASAKVDVLFSLTAFFLTFYLINSFESIIIKNFTTIIKLIFMFLQEISRIIVPDAVLEYTRRSPRKNVRFLSFFLFFDVLVFFSLFGR